MLTNCWWLFFDDCCWSNFCRLLFGDHCLPTFVDHFSCRCLLTFVDHFSVECCRFTFVPFYWWSLLPTFLLPFYSDCPQPSSITILNDRYWTLIIISMDKLFYYNSKLYIYKEKLLVYHKSNKFLTKNTLENTSVFLEKKNVHIKMYFWKI